MFSQVNYATDIHLNKIIKIYNSIAWFYKVSSTMRVTILIKQIVLRNQDTYVDIY